MVEDDCYHVWVYRHGAAIEHYTAGNSSYDSTTVLDSSHPDALRSNTLRHYARQTALDMAKEYGIPESAVIEC